MSNIEFLGETDMNQNHGLGRPPRDTSSALVKLIIKLGLAKDKSGANVVMVVVIIISIALAVFFVNKSLSLNKVAPSPKVSVVN